MKLGAKLPGSEPQSFISPSEDLTPEEHERYNAFLAMYWEKLKLDPRGWAINYMTVIPYKNYEAWYEFEQQLEKEKDNG